MQLQILECIQTVHFYSKSCWQTSLQHISWSTTRNQSAENSGTPRLQELWYSQAPRTLVLPGSKNSGTPRLQELWYSQAPRTLVLPGSKNSGTPRLQELWYPQAPRRCGIAYFLSWSRTSYIGSLYFKPQYTRPDERDRVTAECVQTNDVITRSKTVIGDLSHSSYAYCHTPVDCYWYQNIFEMFLYLVSWVNLKTSCRVSVLIATAISPDDSCYDT